AGWKAGSVPQWLEIYEVGKRGARFRQTGRRESAGPGNGVSASRANRSDAIVASSSARHRSRNPCCSLWSALLDGAIRPRYHRIEHGGFIEAVRNHFYHKLTVPVLVELVRTGLIGQDAERYVVLASPQLQWVDYGLDDAMPSDVLAERRLEITADLLVAVRVVGVEIHHGFEVGDPIECDRKAA